MTGCGVEAVLARSFSFIFNRNMRTLGLLGFTISDEAFYEAVSDGEDIEVDVGSQSVLVAGKTFHFVLSDIERELIKMKGAVEGYNLFGRDLWEHFTKPNVDIHSFVTDTQALPMGVLEKEPTGESELEW